MVLLAVVISLLAASICLKDWRAGLLMVPLFGVIQDPFRKLTPGIPPHYILWVGVIFGLVALVAYSRGAIPGPRALFLNDRALKVGWGILSEILYLTTLNLFLSLE